MGLKATEAHPAGSTVVPYKGEHMSKAELDARYPGKDTLAPYAVKVSSDHYIDAANKRKSNAARYSNMVRTVDKPTLRRKGVKNPGNNAKLQRKRGSKVVIQASRPIRKGEEVFTSYGRGYWR